MKDEILSVKDLSISLSDKTLVSSISFDLPYNKILGILGESGSGKSLTALAIMGLLPNSIKITDGEITFFDKNDEIDLTTLSNKEYQRIRGGKIAIIFQEPMTSFNPRMKLGKQVDELLKIHKPHLSVKERKELIIKLFGEVKLHNPKQIYERYPYEVSGGQKQRVMIAMALAAQPAVVIADEPTTAIDVTTQKSIINLLYQLKDKHNLSIIFISHDISLLANISDFLLVMYKGNRIEFASTEQIIKNPKHPYTRGLIACIPPLDKKPVKLNTVEEYLSGTVKEYPEKEIDRSIFVNDNKLVSIKDLQVSYPVNTNFWGKVTKKNIVLTDINLDIYKGETLGLVGESGSGKSTLGRTILKLIKPDKGEILYKNKNIFDLSATETKKYRTEVQLIFQDPFSSLNPKLTIGEAIAEPIKVHKRGYSKRKISSKVRKLLSDVALPQSFFDRYPHELSGGQRQRVVIARSLAVRPEFIICDESVSALDVSVQAQILNLLNDIKEEYKLTYIFISHDIAVIKYFSDRIAVLNKGKIEEFNFADILYKNPQTKYTKKLLSSVFFLEK